MRSKTLLCLLVGLAYASVDSNQSNNQDYNPSESNNPGWRENQEYEYMISARSFAGFEDIDRDASGVDIKAKLTIRPRSDGNLLAQITGAQYAQIHGKLGENWKLQIPESQLSFKQMPLSQHPFLIVMKNGVIRDLKVNKDVANWEANFIKGVVSQFQLDTQAQNVISSHINALPRENSKSAVYKTMEDTVTGIQETLYEIKPLPKYILQSRPWLAPLSSQGEHIIEIVKNRNHSHATERPLYHYGFDGMGPDYKTFSQTGQFITRATLSEAILSGSLNRYTVQFSSTVDHIMISPTLTDKNHGSVFTFINVTLSSVKPQNGEPQGPSDSVSLGSLVYRYDEPFGQSNQARPGKPYHGTSFKYSSEENSSGSSSSSSSSSSSEGHSRYPPMTRPRRDVAYPGKYNARSGSSSSSSSSYSSVDSEEYWQQGTPKLNEAPESPLLPFTVGYGGNSIKKKFNIVDMVKKVVNEIAKGIQQPERMQQHNIAGKFVTLSSLIRLMNEHEMKQVTAELYHKDQQGQEGAAWTIYCDAVAQSGTAPALLTIQEWIKNGQIDRDEAAILISTTANAARQPTYEYVRTFFQMLQSPEVMHQSSLNESTLLSFTQLVHQIYVSKSESHNKYPVHSFGAFRNSEGYAFLKKEIIPFLGKQLHQAVQNADTQKIHTYIRALGNVGHQNILQEFEPYLEGEKHCTQFQRLLMVLAMDKLAKSDPKVARSVLYKIYQNLNENDQVRVAAVYQIMRTEPSADMLKRMAVATHVDPNPHVNSAVKSSIETASQLQGADYASLRNAAEAARPFLTKKTFGAQYSQNKLRSHVIEQMKLSYEQTFQTFGSDDSFLPDGFKYTLHAKYAGNHQQKVDFQAIVSSVDDLMNVLQQQTKENRQQRQEKIQQHQQKSQGQAQGQWSSEKIAQLLGMQVEDAEQLEGYLYLRMGPYQNMLAYDNKTIERLPEFLQEIEQSLRQGKTFIYNKLMIEREMAISFPTILGFPFIYTYDTPVILSINGKAQATATPPVASNGVLCQPQNINGEYKVRMTLAAKAQAQVGFITPFDHQRYTAGYDKNFQANMQVRGKVQIDIKNMQIETEMHPFDSGKDLQLVHYSTWPYTAKNDIFALQEERRIIQKAEPSQHNYQFGENWVGAPIRLEVIDAVNVDAAWLYQQFKRQDLISALLSPWTGESIQHSQVNLYVGEKQSSLPKVNIRFGYQSQFQSQNQDSKQQNSEGISQLYQITEEPLQRQKEFIHKASAGIQNSKSSVVDASIQFHGQEKISYRATIAVSKSDAEPNSRLLAHFKKIGGDAKGRHYQVAVTAENHIPNTNGLDLNFAMRMKPTSTYQVRVAAGENYENADKISAQIELSKSEERMRYLQEDPLFHQCQNQMKEGNLMLPACENMTMRANFMDQFYAKVQFDEINPVIRNHTYKVYSHLRYMFYPHVQENLVNATGTGKNEIHIQGGFACDLHSVNVSIKTEKSQVSFENVRVGAVGRSIFVSHPVFHLKSRVIGQQLGYQGFRPVCVVDKTAVNTFSNKTYPLSLSSEWTVVLQYVPKRPSQDGNRGQSHNHQLDQETSNYALLVRQMASGREVSISMQTPQTNQQSVEVTMKPGSNKQPQVYVNGQGVQYNQQSAAGLYGGFLQIYTLPNNDVKVELKDAFYVIFDGKRVKLTVLNGKFRSSVRGLCGTFTGEKETDFMDPQECILRHPQEFVSSYTLASSNKQIASGQHSLLQDSQGFHHGHQSGRCYRKEVIPGNYISNQDAGRVKVTKHNDMCTKHQTRYVVENGEICFTLSPVPVCKKQCQQQGTVSKKIPVHCVQQNNVSDLWKKQIDKGASPDFSLKSPTKSVKMQVASSCTQ